MDDRIPVDRLEVLEERGNRDAFWLATMILVVFALFLAVLGIVAFNLRVMLMPIVPRSAPAPAKTFAHFAPARFSTSPARLTNATRRTDVSLGSWDFGQGIPVQVVAIGPDGSATTPSACVERAVRPGGRVHPA